MVASMACNLPLLQDSTPGTAASGVTEPAGAELVCNEPPVQTITIGTNGGDQGQEATEVEGTVVSPSPRSTTATAPRATSARPAATRAPTIAPATGTARVGPLRSVSFLELPFPFDGGNEQFGGTDEQFLQASQPSRSRGRINSFFDHLLPLYPAKYDGREPADPPIADRVLRYDGRLSERANYSGHPAYDYSTFVPRQATTPVFAAADGVVGSVGECCGGALIVRIRHEVEGVGAFRSSYMHLAPDEHFEAAEALEGQPISAGTRIGTMGNTGWSTGHHLHFELRFDANQDGRFQLSEVVDPYGFIPSSEYPGDPWAERTGGAAESMYLWRHPFGSQGLLTESGAGELSVSGAIGGAARPGTFCAEPGSLPPSSQVTVMVAPDPAPAPGRVGSGTSFTVSATDVSARPVDEFDPPARIELPLAADRLAPFIPESEGVFWYSPIRAEWIPVPFRLDRGRGLLLVEIARTGTYALLGEPAQDVYQPRTEILVDGPTSESGAFYDQVTVTLRSEDPSGIERIDYSLDNGSTWQEYTGPFELNRSGIPEDLHGDKEPSEVFGGGPGRHLVLASAVDGSGNIEDPPAFRLITIDPREGPQPTASAPPDINFNADVYTVAQGECTRLRWRVELASSITLDEEEVEAVDSLQVCPEQTTRYEMVAENEAGESSARVTIQVSVSSDPSSPPAAPANLTISSRQCNSSTYSVTISWGDQADNEDGYRVYREGQLIGTVPANSTSYTDNPPYGGPYTYGVEAFNSAGASNRPTVEDAGCLY